MQLESWHWLVLGVVLIILEMFVPSFFLLWFGAGAIVVAVMTFVMPLSFLGATMVWLTISILCCLAWFKFIQPNFKTRTKAGLGAGVIIGETGMIIKAPTPTQAGVIRFSTPKAGASEWACRSQDDSLAVGERAVIVDIVGNELLVSKK